MGLRRRRRRSSCLAMASLLAAVPASALKCAASCSSPVCQLSSNGPFQDCLDAANTSEWLVALDSAKSFICGDLGLPPQVKTLTLQGDKTHVQFTDDSRVAGESLTSLLFIGLDLANDSLPALPDSLAQLQIVDSVMSTLPVLRLSQLPKLESVVVTESRLTGKLAELSERQIAVINPRLTVTVSNEQNNELLLDGTECTETNGGRVKTFGDLPVCVVPDDAAIARRLQTSAGSGSDESQTETSSASMDGSGSAATHDTSTLVLLSMGLPFIYFLYKLALFVFFMKRWPQDRQTNGDTHTAINSTKDMNVGPPHDSEADRPTANASSTSPPSTPTPRAHRRQDKKHFSSNNAGFWVDEELQSWRLDFQRVKLLKSLTLSTNEKRQTLRKQSVTSEQNPREIWLASYASSDKSTVPVSPGGGTTDSLVVVKFLPPKDGQSLRSSISGNGGGSGRDKLKSEMKRQAVFSHPQVVAFIGVAWSRETHLVAVAEYMPQGDLRQWLHRTAKRQAGKWTVLKLQMLVDVTRALRYLHSMQPRLVHGNCNSRNVLLSKSLRAKLSDFGMESRSGGITEEDLLSYSAVGSGRWISPEALLGRETSPTYPDATDVYSLGILIAEVDSHELPFSDLMQANRSAVPETDILQLIAKGALSPTLSPSCPKSIVKLVNACTSYNPKYRPSSTQAQQDLLRILEDFRAYENKTSVTISVGAPRSNPPSNLV